MSSDVRSAAAVGEKEAVALIKGVTQDERVESALSVPRNVVQLELMLAGMRVDETFADAALPTAAIAKAPNKVS